VAAAELVEKEWRSFNSNLPALSVATSEAFPPLTTEVPEIAFSFANNPRQSLRLRWYKISGEHDAASWIAKLQARHRPPLAIIGGATSDRAVRLARAMRDAYPDPEERSPLLLITTATAEKTAKGRP